MEDITQLEKNLNEEIREVITEGNLNKKELLSDLEKFFKNKRQEDINKLKPTNIRLFTVTLEILKANKKLFPIHIANLDYIYSYQKTPLKYSWKSCNFDLSEDKKKIKETLDKIIKSLKLGKEKIKIVNDFFAGSIEVYEDDYEDRHEVGVFNEDMDSYLHLDFDVFDDNYRKERKGEFNILLVTQNKRVLDILPDNEGIIYSNLIFKEK